MYFERFPKIYYDFKIGNNTDIKIVTDITRNVRVIKDILSNITLYDEYDIKEGETPEIIADKFYGSPLYHWVVMLTNDRYDYINDFPLPQAELEKHIKEKYGSRTVYFNVDDPLQVNIENSLFVIQNHGFKTLDAVVYNTNNNAYIPNLLNIYNNNKYYVIRVDTNSFRLAKTLADAKNNNYIVLEKVIDNFNWYNTFNFKFDWDITWKFNIKLNELDQLNSFTIQNIYETHHYEDKFGNVVNENYINVKGETEQTYPVSNYEYEERLNEKKRRIKIISPSLLPVILKNFEDIIR